MTWKETTAMDEKTGFIAGRRSGNYSISGLCREFGISRPAAYKYMNLSEYYSLMLCPVVIPAKAGIRNGLILLDSGLCRNYGARE